MIHYNIDDGSEEVLDRRHLRYAYHKFFEDGYLPPVCISFQPGFEEWRKESVFSDTNLRKIFPDPSQINWHLINIIWKSYEFAKWEGWLTKDNRLYENDIRLMKGLPEVVINQTPEEAFTKALSFLAEGRVQTFLAEILILCRENFAQALRLASVLFKNGIFLRKSEFLSYLYKTMADDIEGTLTEDDILRLQNKYF